MASSHPDVSHWLHLSVAATTQLNQEDKDEIVALCTRAFGEDFSNLFHYVQAADHVLAYLDGRLVGHAVWGTRWLQPAGSALLRTAYVDAVASDPDLWGRGIGSAVMQRLAKETRDFEIGGLATGRPDFYTRLGWERWPGPTGARKDGQVIPTPDDTVMILRTPHTPPLALDALLTVEWRDGNPW